MRGVAPPSCRRVRQLRSPWPRTVGIVPTARSDFGPTKSSRSSSCARVRSARSTAASRRRECACRGGRTASQPPVLGRCAPATSAPDERIGAACCRERRGGRCRSRCSISILIVALHVAGSRARRALARAGPGQARAARQSSARRQESTLLAPPETMKRGRGATGGGERALPSRSRREARPPPRSSPQKLPDPPLTPSVDGRIRRLHETVPPRARSTATVRLPGSVISPVVVVVAHRRPAGRTTTS